VHETPETAMIRMSRQHTLAQHGRETLGHLHRVMPRPDPCVVGTTMGTRSLKASCPVCLRSALLHGCRDLQAYYHGSIIPLCQEETLQ
jgi:hypothetical protein